MGKFAALVNDFLAKSPELVIDSEGAAWDQLLLKFYSATNQKKIIKDVKYKAMRLGYNWQGYAPVGFVIGDLQETLLANLDLLPSESEILTNFIQHNLRVHVCDYPKVKGFLVLTGTIVHAGTNDPVIDPSDPEAMAKSVSGMIKDISYLREKLKTVNDVIQEKDNRIAELELLTNTTYRTSWT